MLDMIYFVLCTKGRRTETKKNLFYCSEGGTLAVEVFGRESLCMSFSDVLGHFREAGKVLPSALALRTGEHLIALKS